MLLNNVKGIIDGLRDGKLLFDDKTEAMVDKIFNELSKIKSDDNRYSIYIKAKRGGIEDFGDYEEYLAYGEVSNYDEFVELWRSYYPYEEEWFELIGILDNGCRAIVLDHKLIYQTDGFGYEKDRYKYDFLEFFTWMYDCVVDVIKALEAGTYNDDVDKNLPLINRTGVIKRKDFFKGYPESRDDYYADITPDEINEFVYLIEEQNDEPIGNYLDQMTAGMFYEYCSLCYKANNYDIKNYKTAKEQYYRFADGRDEGLKDLSLDSALEFEAWYNDKTRFGGHPYEICRGGNSTHVDLFVRKKSNGYFLEVAGKSLGRSIEAIKLYLALRRNGVAVYLYDAKGIKERLTEEDLIGIVPNGVFPRYCESWFPGYEILDFMNVYDEDLEKIKDYITWLKEDEVFLR